MFIVIEICLVRRSVADRSWWWLPFLSLSPIHRLRLYIVCINGRGRHAFQSRASVVTYGPVFSYIGLSNLLRFDINFVVRMTASSQRILSQ